MQELARRSGASVFALERLAEADAFAPALTLARRDALWAIKPLRDQALPLFAAADARDGSLGPEVVEPPVALRPMTEGREVVEDYGHVRPDPAPPPGRLPARGAGGKGDVV